jgi:serine/threonine-protein kinase
MKNTIKLLYYFIAFFAVGAVAAMLIFAVISFEETGKVPDLLGKNIVEAEELLIKEKLFLKIESREHNEELAEGLVMKQQIAAGQKVKIGSEVGVVVSKGSEIYSMPSFEGQLLESAMLTLENLGIEIKKTTLVHSDTVDRGKIIAQRPLPGNIDSNEINFLVSLGPYEVSYRCPSFVI